MITFKEFLAEGREAEYYSHYPELPTSREAMNSYKQEISAKTGIPAARIKFTGWLPSTGSVGYIIKGKVTLTKKQTEDEEGSELLAKIIHDLTEKILKTRFAKVESRGEPFVFKSLPLNTIIFSFQLAEKRG